MSHKVETQVQLTEYYNKNNISKVVNLGLKMLNSPKFISITQEAKATIQGEIAETVCRLIIEDYIKFRGFSDWKVYQGLYIKGSGDGDPKFLTEIDLILVTHNMVYLIEVKSYSGQKIIKGECTIHRDNSRMDVYKQHKMHYNAFYDLFKVVTDRGKDVRKALTPLVFLFGKGDFWDKRDEEYKREMPVIDHRELVSVFEEDYSRPVIWDNPTLITMLDYINSKTSNLTSQHKEYIISRRGKYE